MNYLEVAENVKEYYDSIMPKTVDTGGERVILSDGKTHIITNYKTMQEKDQAMFEVKRVNGKTIIELL